MSGEEWPNNSNSQNLLLTYAGRLLCSAGRWRHRHVTCHGRRHWLVECSSDRSCNERSWQSSRTVRLQSRRGTDLENTAFKQTHTASVSSGEIEREGAVASLEWVTPGAATEGVTPLFFPEKPGDLFCSSLSLSLSLCIAFTRVRVTPSRVGCHLFYLSDLVSALFFVNLPTNFFLRVSPPGGCHPGRSALPPSDATAKATRTTKKGRQKIEGYLL